MDTESERREKRFLWKSNLIYTNPYCANEMATIYTSDYNSCIKAYSVKQWHQQQQQQQQTPTQSLPKHKIANLIFIVHHRMLIIFWSSISKGVKLNDLLGICHVQRYRIIFVLNMVLKLVNFTTLKHIPNALSRTKQKKKLQFL